ncbi:hypothetical protein KIL84_015388 [Mauremys mutica]|uniref:Uncharacterized protein n=1 Tax=Mauremys mutica TaxID=74926 RepID=A0A9D4ARV7_9SAUR|nr:hypothetical protein KIL84_015388 [Mauremys mutica]
MQHDDLRPVIMRRRSSSDLTKQKFGTMPLIPLRGDNTDATMLSANQTLDSTKKRSAQLPSPINEKLIQELSNISLKKNECQADGPGQQVT